MHKDTAELEALCAQTIGAAIEVHRYLGPGLLEGIYAEALCAELQSQRIVCAREVDLPVRYKGLELQKTLRLDVLIGNELIVEVKSVERLEPVHTAQLLTYLRISQKRLGLLLNFNVEALRQGIKRVVNGL